MPVAYHFSNGLWHATSISRPGWVASGERLRDLMETVREETRG